MRRLGWLLILLTVSGSVFAGRRNLEETRDIRETIDLGRDAARTTVVVDNVFGSIEVVAHGRDTVELEARETIRAEDRDALERAREEVMLEIDREPRALVFFVDGPFRDRCDRGRCHDRGYTVEYDFVLRVPESVGIEVSTVNDGDIVIRGVRGDFEVHNVNGPIEMSGLAGSGRAVTVNGRVRAGWDRNPDEDCRFKTVNGDVELFFQPGLDAEVRLDTFNGDASTDFRYEMLPMAVERERGRDGMRKLSLRDGAAIQIGGGGPVMDVSTLNGDIVLGRGE